MMLYAAGYLVGSVVGFYALWVLYLAVMNLSRVKKLGKLSRSAYVLGVPVLVVGLALDFLVNVLVMTVILLELPREATVTSRLKRHNQTGSGYRKRVAAWFEPILDPFDPSGDHV